MTINVKPSERIAVAGVLSPVAVVNSEQFSGVVDVSAFHQVMGIALTGNMASETIDVVLYRCAANGSSAVALKSATQLGASASANDNKQIVFNLKTDDLIASGAQYVKLGAVTGNSSGGPMCLIVLGVDPRYGPVTQPAAVVEVVG